MSATTGFLILFLGLGVVGPALLAWFSGCGPSDSNDMDDYR